MGCLRSGSYYQPNHSLGSQASDGWSHHISGQILEDSDFRNRIVEGIYIPTDKNQQIGRLENAFRIVLKSENAEKKINHRDRILFEDDSTEAQKTNQIFMQTQELNLFLIRNELFVSNIAMILLVHYHMLSHTRT